MNSKSCSMCGEVKPLDDFYKNSSNKTHGRTSRCKPCSSLNSSSWYQDNRERLVPRMRANAYARYYSLTVEEYDAMYLSQNKGCAICHAPTGANGKRLAVDHNHQTEVVRGLLCDDCNTGLGKFKDNPNLLATALNYLKDN